MAPRTEWDFWGIAAGVIIGFPYPSRTSQTHRGRRLSHTETMAWRRCQRLSASIPEPGGSLATGRAYPAAASPTGTTRARAALTANTQIKT
jgi:hypothetical protein